MKTKLILGLALAIGTVACLAWFWSRPKGELGRTYVSLDGRYCVRIIADHTWEYSQPHYYLVEKNGEEIVPKTFIETDSKIIIRQEGQLIWGSDARDTNIVRFIFDCGSLSSWPYRHPSATSIEGVAQGNQLLVKLRKVTGCQSLQIS